ncbi:restriction endonuclease subunit S [Photobacterium leiognathi]|uniref:restriction endonuclease subunit S n=1 Tax=Photobacterium leiognathi TaxID=553611 RepID=UPI002980CF08|nr:restriction endonuclease subunit S [Photobacterium leiognathi]
MGVVKKIVSLSSLSNNSNLRLCLSRDAPKTSRKLVRLLDCLSLFESGKRPKGGIVYLEGENVAISLGGEQIGKDGRIDLSNAPLVPLEFFESSDKGIIKNGDILVCKDGALTGKCCLVKHNFPVKEVMVNEHVYIVRANKKYLQAFLFYLLRDEFTQFQIRDLAYRKKGQPGLNTDHLKLIKVPFFDIKEQESYLKQLENLENEMELLISSKIDPVRIINKVFGEVFDFNWIEFEHIKQERNYDSSIQGFANNIDCRMGVRFHNKAGKYLQSFLGKITTKRIKDFISEPIVLGKSVSPKDYNEEGKYFYIAMSNIKTWAFEAEGCQKVSDEYSCGNLNKTVQKGDILLARSGEGTIGKVALIEDEKINGIFADFTQRIRLTGFDALCAYYYFRSEFFQYLVYTHKKGLGNNTNIFPSQIKEFPMPDWDEKQQAEIVESIKTQLDEQKEIDRKIEEIQKTIKNIVNEAIKSEYVSA